MIERESTRQLLASSIKDLSKRKPVEKITVTDITQNCGISRETFYYYFTDKYELISWMFLDRYRKINATYDQGELSWRESLLLFVSILKEDHIFFDNALKDSSINNFYNSLLDYTRSSMEKSLIQREIYETVPMEIHDQITFYSFGAVGLVCEWIKKHCEDSVELVVDMIIACMSDTMKTLFP